MQILHGRARLCRKLFPEASKADAEAERLETPDVLHQLVRTHPDLDRKRLFLGDKWGSPIQGIDPAEAEASFGSLLNHLIAGR